MRIYIERHGRPFNYLPSVDHLKLERLAKLENAETDQKKMAELEARLAEEKRVKDIARLEKLAQDRIIEIKKHVEAENEVKDQKLR